MSCLSPVIRLPTGIPRELDLPECTPASMTLEQDRSGDYVLPVGMCELQKKLTSAVISSNFSEILSYFDGTPQNESKYAFKLETMFEHLKLVTTHPFLLLKHLQPTLGSRKAATDCEMMSGKFMALIALARRLTDPAMNVAIVSDAGQTADLVEFLLADKGMNVKRYSVTDTKIYKKEQKRRGAQFHLIPNELKDLSAAVYAAFDLMILLDDTFDTSSPYGRGLRMQLRDPARRVPYAPLLRLVALNTAQHAALEPDLEPRERIAACVALRKQAGHLPSIIKQVYADDLRPLDKFLADADGPYPLPSLPPLKRYSHKDVELALYLDDEDQYQVDFQERRGPGGRRRFVVDGGVSEDATEYEDSGAQYTSPGLPGTGAESDAVAPPVEPSSGIKRRRVEVEEGVAAVALELSQTSPLSLNLLVMLNDALEKSRRSTEEVASHRELASRRQYEIEKLREDLKSAVEKNVETEKKLARAQERAERLRTRNENVEAELIDVQARGESLVSKLREAGVESSAAELSRKVVALEAQVSDLEKRYESRASEASNFREQYRVASQAAADLASERDKLLVERDDLEARAGSDNVAAEELLHKAQLEAKEAELEQLRAEIENLRATYRVQMSTERLPHRVERRFGRGGRGGASRQASPHVTA